MLAVVTALAAAYRVPRHRGRRLSEWALSGTLAALAAGLALQAPAFYDAVGEAAGAPHLAQLLVDACALLSAFGTQVVLLHMLHAPAEARGRVQRRAAVTVLTVTLMMLFFFTAAPLSGDADARRMHLADPGLLEFRSLYLAFLAWVFGDIARLCWRFASVAGSRLLSSGLRLIAAGGVVGLAYVAAGVLQVAGAATGDVDTVRSAHQASEALIAVATLLVVAGSTVPALVSRLRGLAGSASTPQPGNGLESLWQALTRALPEVVLPTERGSSSEELYRRVIEIEDARLALRPLRTAELQAAAGRAVRRCGVSELERPAALEAAALALALDRRTRGTAPAGGARRPTLQDATADEPPTNEDLQSEIDWLSSVGRWFGDPALVSSARQMLAEPAHDLAARAR